MTVWRKLTYDLAEDMCIPSEHNIRNMSAVKMAYQFNVRCDLCLWNAESKIVQQNWYSYTQTHIQRYTHTQNTCRHIHTDTDTQSPMHTNTYTHTQPYTDTQHIHTHILPTNTDHTQQNSLRQNRNCVTVFSVDWLQEQQEVLKENYLLQNLTLESPCTIFFAIYIHVYLGMYIYLLQSCERSKQTK